MSETNNAILNNYGIYTISAPELNSSDYATQLRGVFTNINANFMKLANKDFIKGEAGDSVEVITYDLTDETNGFKSRIRSCIESHLQFNSSINTQITYTDPITGVHTIGAFDSFDSNPGKLQMICSKKINEQLETTYFPNSSLYYVFLDSRFANTNFGSINNIDEQYNNITDASCIVIYGLKTDAVGDTEDDYEFKVLENVFPTIYYESNIGLCWKINGNQTGIPVQGLPGKDGEDTKLFIVKARPDNVRPVPTPEDTETEIVVAETDIDAETGTNTETEDTTFKAEITHIFDGIEGYMEVNDYIDKNKDIKPGRNYSALVFKQNIDPDNDAQSDYIYDFYFGNIKLEEKLEGNEKVNKVYATFDTKNSINTTMQNEQVVNAFKSINLANNEAGALPGIFIPLQYKLQNSDNNDDVSVNTTDTLPVHLLSATSIHNTPQGDDFNSDIIITPVNDINNLKITGNTTSNQEQEQTEASNTGNIKVNKYIYIKVNKENIDNLFTDINIEKEYYITEDNYKSGGELIVNNNIYKIYIYSDTNLPYVEFDNDNTHYIGTKVNESTPFFVINDKKYNIEGTTENYKISIGKNDFKVNQTGTNRYTVLVNNTLYKNVLYTINIPMNTALTTKYEVIDNKIKVNINGSDHYFSEDLPNNTSWILINEYGFKHKYRYITETNTDGTTSTYVYTPTLHFELNDKYKDFYNKFKSFLDSVNYTLKYELIEDINTFSQTVFNYIKPTSDPQSNPLSDGSTGVMHIPVLGNSAINPNNDNFVYAIDSIVPVKDDEDNPIRDDSGNYIYLTEFKSANEYIGTDGYNYFPEDFKDNLKPVIINGVSKPKAFIYQWKLNFNYNSFDVEDLQNCDILVENEATDTKTYNINTEYYNVLGCLKSIFTTTLSPDFDSSFMWFNGISLNKKEYTLETTTTTTSTDINGQNNVTTTTDYKTNNSTKYNNKWIIYGWNYNNEDIFSFYKFIPIFSNDFSIDNDTVFNINYNVNITGDNKLQTKDLSVNGNIKCEDLQVYSLSAAGEIKDIYTKDTIIGEKGIVLGYSPSTDTKSAQANVSVSTDGTVITNNIYSSILDSAEVNSKTIQTNFVKVGVCPSINTDNPKTQVSDVSKIKYIDTGEIKTVNTNKITLLRPRNLAELTTSSPTITSKTDASIGRILNINGNNINIGNTDQQIGSGFNNDFSDNLKTGNIQTKQSEVWGNGGYGNGNPGYKYFIKPIGQIIPKIADYQPCINTNISINSTGNTPIIVSNTTPESQLLCMSGIASGYYDGTNTHPGYIDSRMSDYDGTSPNTYKEVKAEGYVENTKFDDVKNFNIQRISVLDKSKSKTNKRSKSINLLADTRTNLINSLKSGFRQCFHINTFTERDNYWYSTPANVYTDIAVLEKFNICKFKIDRKADKTETQNDPDIGNVSNLKLNFDDSSDIKIKLSNIYNVLIGIEGETSYASNPYLRSDSYVKLKLVVGRYNNTSKLDTSSIKTLDICTKTLAGDISYTSSAYKYSNWKNVKDSNPSITSSVIDITSATHGSYNYSWRMRSFMFKVTDFTIAKNSTIYNEIKNAYNSDIAVGLYIVPEYYIHISSDKNNWGNYGDVFRGMLATTPVPIKNNYTISNTAALEHKNSTSGTYLDTGFNPAIEYNYYASFDTSTLNEINSTTIAENGIVHRTNDYVFGLGYSKAVVDHSAAGGYEYTGKTIGEFKDASWKSTTYKKNIPVLFYYDVNPIINTNVSATYYEKVSAGSNPVSQGDIVRPLNDSYDNEGFARRIHAIPLEDIFNAIKHIRETQGTWTKFGL